MHGTHCLKVDFLSGYVEVIDENDAVLYNMDNLPVTHKDIVRKMRVNNCMPHPAWLFKKSAYIALNGYADIQGCEDYDLLLRAIDSGYQLGNCNQIILKYRLSRQSISRDNLYKQYLMMRYIQDKYFYHIKKISIMIFHNNKVLWGKTFGTLYFNGIRKFLY